MDEKTKKLVMYAGLGGLAVWFLFMRKKKGGTTDEQMAEFLGRRRRAVRSAKKGAIKKKIQHTRRKLKNAKGKAKQVLLRREKGLVSLAKRGMKGKGARRRKIMRRVRKGGFFGNLD